MITVAKSFDAPIKLLFPQDLIENGALAGLLSRQHHKETQRL
ncbi:unnamed protein product, partial [Didymodactylos carnosus]